MFARTSIVRAFVAGAALSLLAVAPAGAQAGPYPSFQLPRVQQREFNFAFADADAATSLVFQWREGYGTRSQLSLDVGIADAADETGLLLGGTFGRQLMVATADTPFDLLFTAGFNLALIDDINIIRVPVGVSAGRRFPIEGGLAITPFVHPKFAIRNCGDCGGDDNTELGIEFDLGVDFEFNPQFSLRLSGGFGSEDLAGSADAFGVSLAWYPGRARGTGRSVAAPARPVRR